MNDIRQDPSVGSDFLTGERGYAEERLVTILDTGQTDEHMTQPVILRWICTKQVVETISIYSRVDLLFLVLVNQVYVVQTCNRSVQYNYIVIS